MSLESQNFVTREEFETSLKYLREEIKFREQISENTSSLEKILNKNIDELKSKNNDIKEEFYKMRDSFNEIRRDLHSIASKLDSISIFLWAHLFISGLGLFALICLLKKIGG